MINAIIYKSNAGHTEEYAKLLEKEMNIKAYSLEEKIDIEVDEIIFLGWIMAGHIQGLDQARSKYKIAAVCAVGMAKETEEQNKDLLKNNKILEKYFYLQGGFELDKLHGIYKFMMSFMKKQVNKMLDAKENKNEEDFQTLEMLNQGKDYTSIENLSNVINYIKEINK